MDAPSRRLETFKGEEEDSRPGTIKGGNPTNGDENVLIPSVSLFGTSNGGRPTKGEERCSREVVRGGRGEDMLGWGEGGWTGG